MTTNPPHGTPFTNPLTAQQSNSASPSRTLGIAGLETVYDTLATAIDQAGPEKAQLFLVKLALLNANALANAELFGRHTAAALQDL